MNAGAGNEGAWSEDAIHRWLATLPAPAGRAAGAMHDAAYLEELDGPPVVCVDQCIEGVHFDASAPRATASGKAVLRALSDLAASAARPHSVTLAVRASGTVPARDVEDVILGARDAAERFGASLVAGDLARADGPLGLTVTALGALAAPWPPPERARASLGQTVLLSGPVGGSLGSGRHLVPTPRIEEGIAAARAGATALMDVSDGLAWDLYRLARTAGVGIDLDLDAVPVHDDARGLADPLSAALHDGEDHELIATVDPSVSVALGPRWARIGRVRAGAGLTLVGPDGARTEWSPGDGRWRHGR
ncbi:MAG: thiamine-phosphate kinase [Planctomycetota bacterium]